MPLNDPNMQSPQTPQTPEAPAAQAPVAPPAPTPEPPVTPDPARFGQAGSFSQRYREALNPDARKERLAEETRLRQEQVRLESEDINSDASKRAQDGTVKMLRAMAGTMGFKPSEDAFTQIRGMSRAQLAQMPWETMLKAVAGSKSDTVGSQTSIKVAEIQAGAKKDAAANAPSTFSKAEDTAAAKAFVAGQQKAGGIDEQLSLIDDATKSYQNYVKNSVAGTGPIATLGGLRKFAGPGSEELQTLDAKLKRVSLKTMVNMFQGFSRSIDTASERRAFEATQGSILNDDRANRELLTGSKSLAMKAKAEANAQSAFVQANGSLKGYESPILGKVETVVDPSTGSLHLVPKDRVQEAVRSQGMETLDQWNASGWQPPKAAPQRGVNPSLAAPGASAAPTQPVIMTDGQRQFAIPPEHVDEALRDGLRKVQ